MSSHSRLGKYYLAIPTGLLLFTGGYAIGANKLPIIDNKTISITQSEVYIKRNTESVHHEEYLPKSRQPETLKEEYLESFFTNVDTSAENVKSRGFFQPSEGELYEVSIDPPETYSTDNQSTWVRVPALTATFVESTAHASNLAQIGLNVDGSILLRSNANVKNTYINSDLITNQETVLSPGDIVTLNDLVFEVNQIETYTANISFPKHCSINQPTNLGIQLTADKIGLSFPDAHENNLHEVELTVIISSVAFGFDRILRTLKMKLYQNSETLNFTLIGLKLGKHLIEIKIYRQSQLVGHSVVETEVTDQKIDHQSFAEAFHIRPITLRAKISSLPDVTIVARSQENTGISYILLRANTLGELTIGSANINIDKLKKDLLAQLNPLIDNMSSIIQGTQLQSAGIERQFKGLGMWLAEMLIPDELYNFLHSLEPGSVVVMDSDESWVPWELINDGDDYWGIKYIFTRMPNLVKEDDLSTLKAALSTNERPPSLTTLPQFGVIRSETTQDLPSTTSSAYPVSSTVNESQNLWSSANPQFDNFQDNYTNSEFKIVHIIGGGLNKDISESAEQLFDDIYNAEKLQDSGLEVETVVRAIENARIIHFTCHGHQNPHLHLQLGDTSIATSGAAVTQSLDKFTILTMENIEDSFVFVNACNSATTTWFLGEANDLASPFYLKRVSAFVGTLGTIPTYIAIEFAKQFYENVFKHGQSVGEAIRSTKIALRNQRHIDPAKRSIASLLYCHYGDPFITKNDIVPNVTTTVDEYNYRIFLPLVFR